MTTLPASIYRCLLSLYHALVMEKSDNSDFDVSDSVTAPHSPATSTPRVIQGCTRQHLHLSSAIRLEHGEKKKYPCTYWVILSFS
ncbi:hypothetical protein E2C01_074496 [Portunus trituberculatus]|uniref:Uncharacterized protein n=1 Tax=Portunus trituberculatus TaxID=210409 RepID=A0A5B7IGF3_PORTR|nr:hypothetical protein [Portunus trituberculatus]